MPVHGSNEQSTQLRHAYIYIYTRTHLSSLQSPTPRSRHVLLPVPTHHAHTGRRTVSKSFIKGIQLQRIYCAIIQESSIIDDLMHTV